MTKAFGGQSTSRNEPITSQYWPENFGLMKLQYYIVLLQPKITVANSEMHEALLLLVVAKLNIDNQDVPNTHTFTTPAEVGLELPCQQWLTAGRTLSGRVKVEEENGAVPIPKPWTEEEVEEREEEGEMEWDGLMGDMAPELGPGQGGRGRVKRIVTKTVLKGKANTVAKIVIQKFVNYPIFVTSKNVMLHKIFKLYNGGER